MSGEFIIWFYGDEADLAGVRSFKTRFKGEAQTILLAPSNTPSSDVDMGADPDLSQALESSPVELRPSVCVNLARQAPKGVDTLPCPTFGWGGAQGPEGELSPHPAQAQEQVMAAAGEGLELAWRDQVQVNLPLTGLLGAHRPLAEAYGISLEVGIDHEALDNLTPEDLVRAGRLLEGRRVTVHLPFFDLVPGSPDPLMAKAAMERLNRAAAWSLELGAEQVVAHLGFLQWLHRDKPAFARRLADSLAPMVEKLTQGGCRLALENTFEPDPEVLIRCRNLLSAHGQVGFCLDVGHALCFSGTELETWWRAFAPHLIELHLHDNDGEDDRHWPVGSGRVDWEFIRRALPELEQKPVLTLEPHREPDLWASLRGLERLWGRP